MTHDELLAKINKSIFYAIAFGYIEPAIGWKALLAVVELHKQDFNRSVEGWCDACQDIYFYPCPTIKAIIKELE